MTGSTVAVFHNPWPAQGLSRPSRRELGAQYRYAVWYKANPRSADYMRALLLRRFPDAEWIETTDPNWTGKLSRADTVLLLYPDSIGLGFAPVERAVLAHKRDFANVAVLNGRGRDFRLNAAARLGLRLRRVLEWTMLPEMAVLPVFIVATPLLWAFDAMRGRT
jgi:hypothetical protein